MEFEVDFVIDPCGLDKFAAQGQFVTVLRSVQAFVSTTAAQEKVQAGAALPVAWLSFQPMAERNVLTWPDTANLYAASAAPANGGVITFQARTHGMTPGYSSTLQDGAFGAASVAPDPCSYRAVNEQADSFCFGLMGLALLNGVARPHRPMNIQSTLLNEEVDFTLDPGAITIALTNIGTDGTMMPVEAGGLLLTLSSASPMATVGFNDSTNEFYLR